MIGVASPLLKAHETADLITVLAGDFVAPSLLSSLDSGYGMVTLR